MLTDEQIERFSRQIILRDVGGTGQTRLLRSRVAIAGDEEISRHLAMMLAQAGIGEILTAARITAHMPRGVPAGCQIGVRDDPAGTSADAFVQTVGPRPLPALSPAPRSHLVVSRSGVAGVTLVQAGMTACVDCALRAIDTHAGRHPSPPETSLRLWAIGTASLQIIIDLLGLSEQVGFLQVYDGIQGPRTVVLHKTGDCRGCLAQPPSL